MLSALMWQWIKDKVFCDTTVTLVENQIKPVEKWTSVNNSHLQLVDWSVTHTRVKSDVKTLPDDDREALFKSVCEWRDLAEQDHMKLQTVKNIINNWNTWEFSI